jgi:hypothetical protein
MMFKAHEVSDHSNIECKVCAYAPFAWVVLSYAGESLSIIQYCARSPVKYLQGIEHFTINSKSEQATGTKA